MGCQRLSRLTENEAHVKWSLIYFCVGHRHKHRGYIPMPVAKHGSPRATINTWINIGHLPAWQRKNIFVVWACLAAFFDSQILFFVDNVYQISYVSCLANKLNKLCLNWYIIFCMWLRVTRQSQLVRSQDACLNCTLH